MLVPHSMLKEGFDLGSGIFVGQTSPKTVFPNISDVLNRFPYSPECIDSANTHQSTLRVLMYVFPRQFGLHNAFTSQVDSRETVQPFKDYTLREDEINAKYPSPAMIKVPKRLRGNAVRLIEKLQKQHGRCPYKQLIEYYCPVSLPRPELSLADLSGREQ